MITDIGSTINNQTSYEIDSNNTSDGYSVVNDNIGYISDFEEFIEYLNTYTDKGTKVPFWITIKDGVVQIIQEQYVP